MHSTLGKWTVISVLAAVGCGGDDQTPVANPITRNPPAVDLDAATAPRSSLDAGAPVDAGDGATFAPACAPIDVCRDGKSTVLYNVCFSGSPNTSTTSVCLIDPNGTVYLVPLASGQWVANEGWRQSNGTSALTSSDQQLCAAARAKVVMDAGVAPVCQQ